MATTPSTRIGKIEFYEAHFQTWATNAAAIGLTDPQILALNTLVADARAAFNSAETARAASKGATLVFHDAADDMATIGSNLIRTIRNFAESNEEPGVYALAQIPAPATPTPVGPPCRPFDLTVGLAATGAIELGWKADNPSGASGTVYEIQRSIGGGPFTFIDVAGERTFTDEIFPAGSSSIVCQITGVRSTTRGESAQFLVNFGAGNAGGVTTSAIDPGDNAEFRLAS